MLRAPTRTIVLKSRSGVCLTALLLTRSTLRQCSAIRNMFDAFLTAQDVLFYAHQHSYVASVCVLCIGSISVPLKIRRSRPNCGTSYVYFCTPLERWAEPLGRYYI
jgi:hypothetical protein